MLRALIVSSCFCLLTACSSFKKSDGPYGLYLVRKPIVGDQQIKKLQILRNGSLFGKTCGVPLPQKAIDKALEAYGQADKNNFVFGIADIIITTEFSFPKVCYTVQGHPVVYPKSLVNKLN